MSEPVNMLKVRDDHHPIKFQVGGEAGKFILADETESLSWLNGPKFGYKELRQRVEPWLTSLFQSEHLSLLAGSGLTHAVHKMATGDIVGGMSGNVSEGRYQGHNSCCCSFFCPCCR